VIGYREQRNDDVSSHELSWWRSFCQKIHD